MPTQSNYQPTCVVYPLERRKIIKKTLGYVFGWFLVFAIIVVLAFVIAITSKVPVPITETILSRPTTWAIMFGLLFLIAFMKLLYEIFYYNFYSYDLQENQMVIQKGVIGRTEITTQYNRIQNVFVDQDFWDRIFGLYDVQLITAGIEVATSQPLNHIDGVNRENAYMLRDMILQKTRAATNQRQGL